MTQQINGDQAIAWGTIEAGVSVITGYPGSPGTGTFNALSETADTYGHYTEWCLNERIALDMAAGASQGGKRALVCLKSVGMNVALDTLMVLNMTGVHGGLVILMGDDPGAWGSQNEQDTRPISILSELPMLEPATPEEGREMVRWAYDFSERHRTIVIVRITRSFSVTLEDVPAISAPETRPALAPDREPMSWISALTATIGNHRQLHQTLADITPVFSDLPFNHLEGSGPRGILAGGFVHTKLTEALTGVNTANLSILKLSALYPIPHALIARFLKQCEEVLVLEEVDPYLEDAIKTVGYDIGATPKIYGKRTGHVQWEGELFRWHIQETLSNYLPDFTPATRYTEAEWEKEKPYRKAHCAGCPYLEILGAFREEARALGQNPFLSGDPGCLVIAARYLDTKLCMGSSIGVARGLDRAGVTERTVAVFGDSAFYHGGINALIQARSTSANTLMIVLDNGGALTTGGQSTPDRGLDLDGETGPTVPIHDLAATCGVDPIWEIGQDDSDDQMRSVFREALQNNTLSMVIVRKECKEV